MSVNFHPEDSIHSGWSILGRATTVLGADVKGSGSGIPTEGGRAESAKTNRGDSSNTADGGGRMRCPMAAAREAYRKARDDAIKKHNLVLKISWPETSRVAEWRIITHAKILGKTDKFIRGHIPEVEYGRDFDRYSTQPIREFLIKLQRDEQAGTRTLRLIVMKRLRPIHDLDGEEFWDAFWQCFACTRFLCESTTPANAIPQVIIASGLMGSTMATSASTIWGMMSRPQGNPRGSSTTTISPRGTNSRPQTATELAPSPSCHSRCSVVDSRSGFLDCTDTTQSLSPGFSPTSPSPTWGTQVALSRSPGHSR